MIELKTRYSAKYLNSDTFSLVEIKGSRENLHFDAQSDFGKIFVPKSTHLDHSYLKYALVLYKPSVISLQFS